MKLIKRFIIIILGAFVLGAAGFFVAQEFMTLDEPAGEIANVKTLPTPEATEKIVEEPPKSDNIIQSEPEQPLPEKIFISVPFTSQAPFANWDERHEEACEEASLIMVKYYLDKKSLTPEIAETEIQKLIEYEIKTYGRFEDSDAAEMAKIAKDYFDIQNLKVIYDLKKEDIKKYLAKGKPVIIPAAGRMLGNPNFKQPGPPYHALVLVGYDGDTIITNDPGTRKGKSYEYDLDVLFAAIHDFPGDLDRITEGRKAMLVLE